MPIFKPNIFMAFRVFFLLLVMQVLINSKSLLLKDCQRKLFHLTTALSFYSTSITFKCYFIFPGCGSHSLAWMTGDRKEHSVTFREMFLGLFKFSAIQMCCFAYSCNSRRISTFNQLQVTGWHWRFRIAVSGIHHDRSPQPRVETEPDQPGFENIGLRMFTPFCAPCSKW